MKTKLLILILSIAFSISALHVQAKIKRVGFFANQIAGQDYTTFQSANDNAASGDTVLIFPGSWSGTINRKLVVIGYGYFLAGMAADSSLQIITGPASLNITLANNSDSTVIEGLGESVGGVGGLSVATGYQATATLSNISIQRCYVDFSLSQSSYTTFNNLKISQCYITNFHFASYVTAIFNQFFLENNYINAMAFAYSPTNNAGVFKNNIFNNAPNFNNSSFSLYNNIFLSTTAPSNIANCLFDYNIATNNTIPNNSPYNHNKTNVDISTVFVGYPTEGTYSNDDRYNLAAGSPAIGAGEGGSDCGIFGGTNPYRLGGIPPIPSFYKLTAPGSTATSNPYTITFSVRSNN